MATVKKNMLFIKMLASSHDKQRDSLLKTMNASQMEALRQIVNNILEGTLILSPNKIKSLHKHRTHLRTFAGRNQRGRIKLSIKLRKVWPDLLKSVLPQLELLE